MRIGLRFQSPESSVCLFRPLTKEDAKNLKKTERLRLSITDELTDDPVFGSSRSRAEGYRRSEANKVRPHLGNVAARVPKASPRAHRRGGPQQVTQIGLRPPVDVASALYALTRTYAGVSDSARWELRLARRSMWRMALA